MSRTLYDKIFDAHVVQQHPDGTVLLYIDRHLINEVTSPQAFESMRIHGRKVWRSRSNLAVADHNVPTKKTNDLLDPLSRIQLDALERNCLEQHIEHFGLANELQGIVHVVGPELGYTLPGMTIVCGDSHTSTHGALGALAFGIGTAEIEHVLSTQTLITRRSKTFRIQLSGVLPVGCSAKDVALMVIGKIGTAGATGHVIEFSGPVVSALTMEARMTLCNMSIEAGARAGLIAVDETTLAYCEDRLLSPRQGDWSLAASKWRPLQSDADARFDTDTCMDVSNLTPQVTWGTSPEMVVGISDRVPSPTSISDLSKRASVERALNYMGLEPGTAITDIPLDKIFIGSCTNGRIEDFRTAADVLKRMGGRIAPNIKLALAVPGSASVKEAAEREGLDTIFKNAGFEWRDPGCSMCLAMNADRLSTGERVASTSNRNFEGRQGAGGRSHLVSPAMAAAAAMTGRFSDVRTIYQ